MDQSIRWAAPELLEGREAPTDKGDIYSLGMTILEVLTGSQPYAGIDALTALENIISGKLPERPEKYLPSGSKPADLLWSLLNDCWAYDPQQRPAAAKVQDKLGSLVAKFTQEFSAGV
ncbi:Proto-oncogene tyrosine-protein kinase ROS [Rhizoctonia solani AG-1 IB]|uniref:Proto-oncogene tyrosine-protein kinase ROS n=1 Tax=Thanatephorus cucumeris (strain AG1-IB / isolate 7/3/14) TaxID=1108050 RepID=M5C6Q7_THACB|nr:Proto-oncogene tyrosine-protein kinase ROS [Rhizoctonia solani AG-1 IB]